MEDTFKTIASPPVQPQDDLRNWQNGASKSGGLDQAFCLRRAQTLFACYRRDEANDPEIYTAAIAAVFSDYPRAVVERAADPRTGVASEYKFLPAVAEVKEFCDREQARLHRMQQEPVRRTPIWPWNWVAPPGSKYQEMAEKHGRPIGRFEQESDKWNRIG
jgi:hypothetical protein